MKAFFLSGSTQKLRAFLRLNFDHPAAGAASGPAEDAGSKAKAFGFALLATLIFFFPSLTHQSSTAGFMYTGDVLGFYWPLTLKMQHLISGLHFNAIDVSVFNGSSDFYPTPNFFGVQPFLVLYALASAPFHPNQQAVGHAIVVALALQSFISCYFAVRLGQRFVGLSFGGAALAAVVFSFGPGLLSALGEPEYLFSVGPMPWCIYSALAFARRPRILSLPWAMFPTFSMLLGGYMPLAVAALFLAVVVITFLALVGDQGRPIEDRIVGLVLSAAPVGLGALVTSPFLIEVLRLMRTSPSAHTASLFYSAHQLSELPQDILRMFSPNWVIPGPTWEMSTYLGMIGAYIAFAFLLTPSTLRGLSPREWTLLKWSFAVYALTAIAIYGAYTPVSDMVYYFVPQVGGMHIYQRFLYPASLMVGIALALMLTGLVRTESSPLLRVGGAVCLILTFYVAYQVAFHPDVTTKVGIGNNLVFDLICLSLFACVLVVPGHGLKMACAIFLTVLPTLNGMYGYGRPGNDLKERRIQQPILLDPAMQTSIVNYMRAHANKDLVKYIDLTPLWMGGIEPFSKSFPYLVQDKIHLSTYSGFNFYLSPPADYMAMMPIQGAYQMNPDWSYVRRTRADFVVALESDLPALAQSGLVTDAKDVLHLPGGVAMAPLGADDQEAAPLFDNGYFRVDYPDQPTAPMRNIALGKLAQQSSKFDDGAAARAVDGNTNGVYSAGSVAHTNADPNGWLDVDLGQTQKIDAIQLWNRTDCCGERLAKFWLMVSNESFSSSEPAAAARARPGVWSKYLLSAGPQLLIKTGSLSGRYVRVQLDGTPDPGGRYLSLAELQVLQAEPAAAPPPRVPPSVRASSTNYASFFRIDVSAPSGAKIAYELWNHKGLHFRLDGKPIEPQRERNLTVIPVGPGEHRLDVHYANLTHTLFWLMFAAFLASCAATSAMAAAQMLNRLRGYVRG